MSHSTIHPLYDPLANPSPAEDEDFEPSRGPLHSWDRRSLAQALLNRARERQDAIADAFVDAILDGKISLFRLLMDLEQAAVNGEAEAQEAHQPTLADVLLPMLQRERRQAAAEQAAAEAPQPTPPLPALAAPAASAPSPQPGITDMHATAAEAAPIPRTPLSATLPAVAPLPCRTRPRNRKIKPADAPRPSRKSPQRIHQSSPGDLPPTARLPHTAPQPAYTHAIPIVWTHNPSPRRTTTLRRANHSKHENLTAPLP